VPWPRGQEREEEAPTAGCWCRPRVAASTLRKRERRRGIRVFLMLVKVMVEVVIGDENRNGGGWSCWWGDMVVKR